ncbi:MAG: Holliday junction branch migration protein RuvA [Flavobacteriales bacterium]|nr:Holliday junction branch migration protein RuvA [Flavobacteriales bacterium]
MIHYLRGTLIEKSPVHAVLETGGMAYYLQISLYTFGRLPEKGEVVLYTHLNISGQDYSLSLYGFDSEEERDLFRKLISVNGVGPNTARIVLSNLRPDELKLTIQSRDAATLRRIKGIGEKTAERIVIDLRDKISKPAEGALEKVSALHNNVKSEALMALTSLGVDRTKADKLAERLFAANPAITLEELIRQVLKQH